MRLVDADTCPCNDCDKFCDKNCCDKFVRWLKGCDYSMEDVVKQLENASCYIADGEGHAGHLIFTDEAIQIVKGGTE